MTLTASAIADGVLEVLTAPGGPLENITTERSWLGRVDGDTDEGTMQAWVTVLSDESASDAPFATRGRRAREVVIGVSIRQARVGESDQSDVDTLADTVDAKANEVANFIRENAPTAIGVPLKVSAFAVSRPQTIDLEDLQRNDRATAPVQITYQYAGAI